MTFENFKCNLLHRLKDEGDLKFLYNALLKDEVSRLFEEKSYAESLYTLALIDYLSRIHNIELVNRYEQIRKQKMKELLFSPDVLLLDATYPQSGYKERAVANAIPEFLRHNIVEGDVRNVV